MNDVQFKIPIADNCVLALHLDFQSGREHILMGELFEIQRYLRGYKQAVILAEEKREIGTFVKECFHPMSTEMADVRVGLAEGLEKEKTPLSGTSKSFLEKLYHSDNMCHRFLAVRLWQEYHKTKTVYDKRLKNTEDKEYISTFIDRV